MSFLETRFERLFRATIAMMRREDGSANKETDLIYGSSCPVFATKTVNI